MAELSLYSLNKNKLNKTDVAIAAGKTVDSDGKEFTVKKSVPSNAVFTDTVYDLATLESNGLMSIEDKSKLDSIEHGANKYSLPAATKTVLGGIKVGDGLSISNGYVLSSNKQTDNNFTNTLKTKLDGIESGANKYTASSSTLGGIKVGSRLSISNDKLSADKQTDNNFTNVLKTKLDGIESGADEGGI